MMASRLPATLPVCVRQISRAVAGGRVDRHVRRPGDAARGGQESCGLFLCGVEIGEEAASRGQLGPARAAETVQRRNAKAGLERLLAGETVEAALARDRRNSRHLVRRDGFRWRQAGEFGPHLARPAGDQLEPAGRNVGRGDRPLVANPGDRREPVGTAAFEQCFLGQRSGRDQPHDRTLDQCLRAARLASLGGAFGLLGDGDAVAGADQPGEVGFGGMDGDAAHGHRLASIRAALGERDVERRRRRLRIVEEQLEEVAHPVK